MCAKYGNTSPSIHSLTECLCGLKRLDVQAVVYDLRMMDLVRCSHWKTGVGRSKCQSSTGFSAVGEQAIDLLKIDIEGSEYGILEDPRFAALDVEYLVMEWHEFSGENRSSEALVSRLRNLNYELICLPAVQGANGMMVGMVFGRRLKELTGRPSS